RGRGHRRSSNPAICGHGYTKYAGNEDLTPSLVGREGSWNPHFTLGDNSDFLTPISHKFHNPLGDAHRVGPARPLASSPKSWIAKYLPVRDVGYFGGQP